MFDVISLLHSPYVFYYSHSPKYFSKNVVSLSITPCFLTSRPPPKRETGGMILSISVPVVFIVPSRKELLKMCIRDRIIGNEDVSGLEPQDRDIAMVFQNYALYPHMNVRKNIEYGLKAKRVPKEERQKRIDSVVKLVQLEDQLDKLPAQMSGCLLYTSRCV